MHARAYRPYTEAEYFALEEESELRHEFIDGQIYAMAGGTGAHSLISANVVGVLHALLRGKPCRPFTADRRIEIEATGDYVFPDAVVICPPFDLAKLSTSTPRVVVEVLSPSTRKRDLSLKLPLYRSIATLTDALFIEPKTRRVVHHRRVGGEWSERVVTEGAVPLASLEIELPLDEIYEGALDAAG